MKRLILVALSVILSLPLWADDDRPITVDKMPVAAREFIRTHFPRLSIAVAKQEGNFMVKNYDVIFSNGNKVEFDRSGVWTNVDCKYSKVPDAVIPVKIASYISVQFPGTYVVHIEKDDRRYEVELSNKVDLKFTNSFEIIEVDF